MGTNDFIKRYRLDKKATFPYNRFLEDFKNEFIEMMEVMNGYDDMKNCRFCINSMRDLWDNINQEAYKPLPEFLWNSFYRNTVCKLREKVRGFNQKSIEYRKQKDERNYEKVG